MKTNVKTQSSTEAKIATTHQDTSQTSNHIHSETRSSATVLTFNTIRRLNSGSKVQTIPINLTIPFNTIFFLYNYF